MRNEASDQGKGNAKAKGLLKAMTKFSFLATMHFLMDVVPIVQRVSKAFQREDADFSIIMPLEDASIEALGGGFAETDGTHLSKRYSCFKQGEGGSPTTFQGIPISDSGLLRSSFQSARWNLLPN